LSSATPVRIAEPTRFSARYGTDVTAMRPNCAAANGTVTASAGTIVSSAPAAASAPRDSG
jgi:hypothetical protein